MPSWINENKSEGPVSPPSEVQTQPNSAGNGVGVKPRVRARRGQATDPHSIAERVSFFIYEISLLQGKLKVYITFLNYLFACFM